MHFVVRLPLVQANGILVAFALCVMFVWTRKFTQAAIWAVVFTVLFLVLHTVNENGLFELSEARLVNAVDFALSLLGSSFAYWSHKRACIAGGVIVALSLVIVLSCNLKRNAVVSSFLIFLIMTALASGIARSSIGLDLSYATSRYTFVSLLTVATLYVGFFRINEKTRFVNHYLVSMFVLSGSMCALSYGQNFNQYLVREQLLTDSIVRWKVAQTGLSHPNSDHAASILQESVSNGIYNVPEIKIEELCTKPEMFPVSKKPNKELFLKIEHFLEDEKYILVDGWAFLVGENSREPSLHVVFKGDKKTYWVKAHKRIRTDVTSHFRKHGHDNYLDESGFMLLLDKRDLPTGDYEIGIGATVGQQTEWRLSEKTIVIPASRA